MKMETSSLLFDRFPKIGFNLHSLKGKRIKNYATEEWAKKYFPKDEEVIYIFGLGIGNTYPHFQTWLQEDPKRELVYIIDDPESLPQFLQGDFAKAILENSQVHLFLQEKNLAAQLAYQFPVKKIALFPAPHCKKKVDRFRLELLRKTLLSESLFIDRLHSYIHFKNFVKNVQKLPSSFYFNDLKGKLKNIPAIICGAGPSLSSALPHLKNGLLIAGGSAIAALSSQGILPHLGVMVDPNHEEYLRMKASSAFEIPMLYNMRTENSVFNTFNGPTGYIRSAICSLTDLWMEEKLGLKGPLIGKNLSSESLSVTTLSLALAVFLGCNPIILCGVDLAYTGGRRYAEGVTSQPSAIDEPLFERISTTNQPIHTCTRWIMEASALSSFARKNPKTTFFNASHGLPIPHIPYLAEISLPQTPDLTGHLFSLLQQAKILSHTNVLQPLEESLQKCLTYATILENKTGSTVLAEMELKEEIAYKILFYDTFTILDRHLKRSKEPEQVKWRHFATLVRQYCKILNE